MCQKWNIINELLKHRSLHVRELAKLIKEPLSSVSRTVSRLIEANVLDYQFVGKNKTVQLKKNLIAKEHVYIAEHQKLIKFIQYPQYGILIEEILANAKEPLVVLFGSYARFDPKPESDIDLYIETKKRSVKKMVDNIHTKINTKIGLFDPQQHLIKEIIKNHVILRGVELYYEKNKLFA